MSRWFLSVPVLGLCAATALAAARLPAQQPASPLTPADAAKADSGRPPYTPADVHFMQGMIAHHSQAVVMAGWAPSHGARPDVLRLCDRINVSQRDEIVTMQRWLRERHETVPEADFQYPPKSMAGMPGMEGMLMPGMLTPEQMTQLDHARGPDFDRLFLTFMMQHHLGALTMVGQLFDSQGAAQDDRIFKFASDVSSDQTAEIGRMRNMLAQSPSAGTP
jgi:uncharacterized protein (DUF305 family)